MKREIVTERRLLKKCNNGHCDRQTTRGVEFCCPGCALAHAGGYEIHDDGGPFAHSASCDERHAVRGSR